MLSSTSYDSPYTATAETCDELPSNLFEINGVLDDCIFTTQELARRLNRKNAQLITVPPAPQSGKDSSDKISGQHQSLVSELNIRVSTLLTKLGQLSEVVSVTETI